MLKMRTTPTSECQAIAAAILTIAAAIVLLAAGPATADPEEGEEPEPRVTDSSTERLPAITAFPRYPPIARRDRIEGEATVCFKIAPNGRILDPVVESSTHRIFEKPALRAIRESRFEPLAPGEELSGSTTCRTYRFRLDPVSAAIERLLSPRIRPSSPA